MNWLQQLDLDLFRAIHIGWHSWILDPIFLAITCTGLGYVQVGAIGLLAVQYRMRRFIVPLLSVWLISGVVNTIIKHTVQRDRPSMLAFAIPQEGFKHNSFPSGHTVTSFAIAGMILIWTWNSPKRWMGCLALLWASLVGFSRIYRGVHWPTDVFAAAVLGLCTAILIGWLQRRYPRLFGFCNRLFRIEEPSVDLRV